MDAVSLSVTFGVIEDALSLITKAVRDGDKVRLKEILSSIGDRGNYEVPSAKVLGEGGIAHLQETMGGHRQRTASRLWCLNANLLEP